MKSCNFTSGFLLTKFADFFTAGLTVPPVLLKPLVALRVSRFLFFGLLLLVHADVHGSETSAHNSNSDISNSFNTDGLASKTQFNRPGQELLLQQKILKTESLMGCSHFRNEFWDQLVNYVLETETIPSVEQVSSGWDYALQSSWMMNPLNDAQEQDPEVSKAKLQEIRSDLMLLIDTALGESQRQGLVQNYADLAEILVGLDLGDETTPYKESAKPLVAEIFARLEKHVAELGVPCKNAPPVGEDDSQKAKGPPFKAPSRFTPAVFGARWAMAAAYQACQSIELPPLHNGSSELQGIKTKCCHSDGVGSKRYIVDLNKVRSSHPYIRTVPVYEKQCFRVVDNPLIYDYGGRPKIRTEIPDVPFDLFVNAGSGTNVLGTDCSGFVFLSLASAGLRIAPGRSLKGSDIYGPSSHSFLNPQKNGMMCLERIVVTPSQSMRAGDIVSIPGHTFIIDSIGADPLGISKAQRVADCENLSQDNFDFVIIQSSNSKNGVGINRFVGRDYVEGVGKIRNGFLKYARVACLAKIQGTTSRPNWSDFSIVRHNGSTECVNSRLRIVKDSCIERCAALQ